MKKKMLWALWLCLAFTVGTNAQDIPSDTIAITPFPGTKVWLIGNNMQRLIKENNFELQKNQFVADIKEAAKDASFAADTKEAIYLVSPDGRRRLKAKPEELVPFDTQKEIQFFTRNLPPIHYTIFDLQRLFEYHIFLSDPNQLEQLSGVNFTIAIDALTVKEKHPNQYSRLDIDAENNDWRVSPVPVRRRIVMELSTGFSVGLYNSTLSPGIGVNADFVWLNKHEIPKYKIGTGITLQALSEYEDFQFKNVHGALSIDLRLMWNVARSSNRTLWLGFLAGRLRSGTPEGSTIKHPLANRLKFGLSVESGFLAVDYAIIPPRGSENTLHNLTFRFRF